MSFKEQLKKDLDVFINPDEFGGLHRIDNRNLNIVIDDDKLEERKKFDGLNTEEIIYYVKAEEFGEIPKIGTPQKFDGRFMYVTSAVKLNGLYEIILSQNRGE